MTYNKNIFYEKGSDMMRKLTKKQLEVMKVLWDKNKPMISSEIEKSDPSFNTNTVQTCLRELLKKGYIKVADIVYSGTVLTRSYLPTFTKTEYLMDACNDIIGNDNSSFSLCVSLIKEQTNADDLSELEKIIEKRKIELNHA